MIQEIYKNKNKEKIRDYVVIKIMIKTETIKNKQTNHIENEIKTIINDRTSIYDHICKFYLR